MPVVRELTATLGFAADTTGATLFNAALKRTKTSIDKLVEVGERRLLILNRRFANFFLGGAATTGAALLGKKFADLETSYDELARKTKDTGGVIRKEIESILDDKLLKNLVNEVDLVGAAFKSASEGANTTEILRFLRLATSLSVVSKESVSDLLEQLTKGEVSAILKLIGELPIELQEIFKTAGIGPEQAGLIGRRALAEQKLLAALPDIEKTIAQQREQGLLTFKELGGAFEKLTVEVGERTLPAFKSLNDELIPFIGGITKFVRGDISLRQLISPKAEPGTERARKIQESAELADKILDFLAFPAREVVERGPLPGAAFRGRPLTDTRTAINTQTTNNRGGDMINNINVTVRGDAGNGRDIGTEIAEEIGRKLGTISEQARQSTIIRGGP